MPAADQIQTSQWQYDAFLSSSDDLENGFAGHFKAALNRAKISVYTQENETVHHVEELGSDRKKGIEKSMFLIVVLSKGYASSARCLNELVHILKCLNGHVVIPVFYDVDPSHVEEQKGSFENAFVEHEERFGEELGRVESWRDALREVCLLRGQDLPRSLDGHEAKNIGKIIKEILERRTKLGASSVIDSHPSHTFSPTTSSTPFQILRSQLL